MFALAHNYINLKIKYPFSWSMLIALFLFSRASSSERRFDRCTKEKKTYCFKTFLLLPQFVISHTLIDTARDSLVFMSLKLNCLCWLSWHFFLYTLNNPRTRSLLRRAIHLVRPFVRPRLFSCFDHYSQVYRCRTEIDSAKTKIYRSITTKRIEETPTKGLDGRNKIIFS